MERFRVAHLTDLHVGDPPYAIGIADWKYHQNFPLAKHPRFGASTHSPQVLDAAVLALYTMNPRVDAILFSGDLATTGSASDLQLAHAYLNDPATNAHQSAQGRATFRSVNVPMMVFPGNHDRYSDALMQPGGTQFDATFTPPQWDPAQGMCAWQLDKGQERLVIVAGDFCLKDALDADSKLGWIGQGKAYDVTLNAMCQETAAQRAAFATCAVLWAVHFPPVFQGIDPLLKLVDEQRLLAAAQAANVSLILAGHTHDARIYPVAPGSRMGIACGGSVSQYCVPAACGNCFNIWQFDVLAGAAQASVHAWTFRDAARGFTP